jgi:O-succinylbenzoate synthase
MILGQAYPAVTEALAEQPGRGTAFGPACLQEKELARILVDNILPALAAAPELTAGEVAKRLAPFKGHPMAKAAIEMAVLDAELRAADMSLGNYLGAVRPTVPAGVSVGIIPSMGELLDAVARYLEAGYLRIKLKIKPG